jgi:hypothetical protein
MSFFKNAILKRPKQNFDGLSLKIIIFRLLADSTLSNQTVDFENMLLSYTVTKSEPNEASLWKITLQKRGNSYVDTGTFMIYPATHTVFIHSSVREKCSRIRAGTFCRSKKVNFLELSFAQIFPGNFPHSVFLKDISGKFPHSLGKNVLPMAHPEKAYCIKQKT